LPASKCMGHPNFALVHIVHLRIHSNCSPMAPESQYPLFYDCVTSQVVVALSERGRDHVPFRSSRLTHVLKDSLGGNSRTVLVANV
jgi:hypothetical protein